MSSVTLSIRERLLQALLSQLVAALPMVTVRRAPVPPALRAALPLLILEPYGETVAPPEGHWVERRLTLGLNVLTRGDDAAQQADQIQLQAHQALMQPSSDSLTPWLLREQECDWETEDADLTALRLITRYQLIYRSHPHDFSKDD